MSAMEILLDRDLKPVWGIAAQGQRRHLATWERGDVIESPCGYALVEFSDDPNIVGHDECSPVYTALMCRQICDRCRGYVHNVRSASRLVAQVAS